MSLAESSAPARQTFRGGPAPRMLNRSTSRSDFAQSKKPTIAQARNDRFTAVRDKPKDQGVRQAPKMLQRQTTLARQTIRDKAGGFLERVTASRNTNVEGDVSTRGRSRITKAGAGEEHRVGWQTFGTWMEEEEDLTETGAFVTVEVQSVRRHRLRCTDALKHELDRLHDLQLNSLNWIENVGTSSLVGDGTQLGLQSLLSMAPDGQNTEVASSFKVSMGGIQVACEMAPLVDVAPWDLQQQGDWPPKSAAVTTSSEQLTEWLKLAAVVQKEEVDREQEQQDSHYHMATASLLLNSTAWQQLKNLPIEVIWQLVIGFLLLGLILYDTASLLYAGFDGHPSSAACGFVATLQFVLVFMASYFLLRGVWLENAFQMDAATVMLVVLVLVNTDKGLTELSLEGALAGYRADWYFRKPTACYSNVTLVNQSQDFSVVTSEDMLACCSDISLAISCAALTHVAVVPPGPVFLMMRFAMMVLMVILEKRTRRTFGWRYFRTSGYDVALRQQIMR